MQKRELTFFIILFGIVGSAFSQSGWGIKAGAVYSNLRGTDYEPYLGAAYGVFRDFELSSDVSLMLEGLVATRGSELDEYRIRENPFENFDGDDEAVFLIRDFKIRVTYLDLSLSLKYTFFSGSDFEVSPYLGWSMTFYRKDKSNSANGKYNEFIGYADTTDYDVTAFPSEGAHLFLIFDVSTISGVALTFYKHYSLEFRYFYSYTDVRSAMYVPINNKFHAFYIMLGYKF